MSDLVLEAHARRCRSCQAPIVWAVTTAGRRMPVDRVPDPTGSLLLSVDRGELHVDVALTPAEGEPRYHPHFASCPDASRWRRRS